MESISSMLPQRKGPVIGALLLIFGIPLVLAWFVFHYYASTFNGGLEHGELITPTKKLAPPLIRDLQGNAVSADLFRGKWTVVYHTPDRKAETANELANPCNKDCLALMDSLRRIRIAQDRSMREVRLVLVLPEYAEQVPSIADQFNKGLHVVTADHWPLHSGSVYLIDPQGFLVMRYPPGFDPVGLLKDLKLLLKLAGK
ncbi:MAG: SCO family protein [Halothiobacillus sp.]